MKDFPQCDKQIERWGIDLPGAPVNYTYSAYSGHQQTPHAFLAETQARFTIKGHNNSEPIFAGICLTVSLTDGSCVFSSRVKESRRVSGEQPVLALAQPVLAIALWVNLLSYPEVHWLKNHGTDRDTENSLNVTRRNILGNIHAWTFFSLMFASEVFQCEWGKVRGGPRGEARDVETVFKRLSILMIRLGIFWRKYCLEILNQW